MTERTAGIVIFTAVMASIVLVIFVAAFTGPARHLIAGGMQ